jgi:hypothetical protein
VHNLQFWLNPQAEHLLDWFHVTMGLTVLTQTAKGLPETIGEGEEQPPLRSEVLKALESNKWHLWHGNVFQALQHLQFVETDLGGAPQRCRCLPFSIREFQHSHPPPRQFVAEIFESLKPPLKMLMLGAWHIGRMSQPRWPSFKVSVRVK